MVAWTPPPEKGAHIQGEWTMQVEVWFERFMPVRAANQRQPKSKQWLRLCSHRFSREGIPGRHGNRSQTKISTKIKTGIERGDHGGQNDAKTHSDFPGTKPPGRPGWADDQSLVFEFVTASGYPTLEGRSGGWTGNLGPNYPKSYWYVTEMETESGTK